MIVLLIAVLMVLLYLQYIYFDKEVCAASFLFTAPFIVMCIVALVFANEWHFSMHWNTFWVIIVGNLAFTIGAMFAKKISTGKLRTNNSIIYDENESRGKYCFFLVLQSVSYLWKVRLIMNFARANGVGGSLSAALAYYDHIIKFTTLDTFHMPGVLSIGLDISNAFAYVCACILAQKLMAKEKKNLMIVFLNFAISVLGGLSSGGRGAAIRYLIAFTVAYLILYFRKNHWKKTLKFKYIIRIFVVMIFTCGFFIISRQMVGRGVVTDVGAYLAKYIGAQLYNLDYYLNEAFRKSIIFGQETFRPLIQFICSKFGISEWTRYTLDLPFLTVNGNNMGNVYTTFYAYIHDFGYLGVVILPLIFGFIAQIIYKLSRSSSTNHAINFGLVLYADVVYSVLLSFFSNKFGDLLITMSMLKKAILMWLIILFLFHFKFKGFKIKIDMQLNRNIKIQ